MIAQATDHWKSLRAFEPADNALLIEYARRSIVTHLGRPYDHRIYPHAGAPGGPLDAYDLHSCRTISMQWGSRLGKSFVGQCCFVHTADVDPLPMMFASSEKKTAMQVARRTRQMFTRNETIAARMPAKVNLQMMDLGFTDLTTGWSRSPSTLADTDAARGWAGELDKWSRATTSREADPLKLFTERFKNHWHTRKVIFESTPSISEHSAIERMLLAGTNCRFHVPCPHCGEYQALAFGSKDSTAGVKWSGSTIREATKTAHYVCQFCNKKIEDHSRIPMMSAGVWCPISCRVNSAAAKAESEKRQRVLDELDVLVAQEPRDEKRIQELRDSIRFAGWAQASWVVGEPSCTETAASYQLSSLYALALAWSDVVHEFLSSKDKPALLQNFVNSWLGECWQLEKPTTTPAADLLDKIEQPTLPRGVVPEDHSMIAIGVDRQKDHFPFVIASFAPGWRAHVLDYGQLQSLDDLLPYYRRGFEHEDGGDKVYPSICLIDARYRPKDQYDFAKKLNRLGQRVFPSFGSGKQLSSMARVTRLGIDTAAPGIKVVHVCTPSTQYEINHWLASEPGSPRSISLFASDPAIPDERFEHLDFCVQVQNDGETIELDSNGYERRGWNRIDFSKPNDFRDCLRYAMAGVELVTMSNGPPARVRIRLPDQPSRDAFEDFDHQFQFQALRHAQGFSR